MDQRWIEPFLDATLEAFNAMLHMDARFEPPEFDSGAARLQGVSCGVHISGEREGILMLSVPPETARRLAGLMSATDELIEEEDLADAVGELTEIIAASGVSRSGVKRPTVVRASSTGNGHGWDAGGSADAATVRGECECGEFVLTLAMQSGIPAGGEA